MPTQKVIIMRDTGSMAYSLLKETSKLVFWGSTKTWYVFASKKNPMLGPGFFCPSFHLRQKHTKLLKEISQI